MSSIHNNMASPFAGMPFLERKALAQSNTKVTITWKDEKSSETHQVTGIPLDLFLAYCPKAAQSFQLPTRGNNTPNSQRVYNLGPVADLIPGAVRYVVAALVKACQTPSADAMSPTYHEPANVLRHMQCLAALKKMGILRCVVSEWRGATMDAVRAAGRVTAEEFTFFYGGFFCERGGEPMLLKNLLNVIVYNELTDEVESPDTEAINRFVTGGHPALAVLKRDAERKVERKLVKRTAMEEKRSEQERRNRERKAAI